MNDTKEIVRRLNSLRGPHREHAIIRIERLLAAVEEHEDKFAPRLSMPLAAR